MTENPHLSQIRSAYHAVKTQAAINSGSDATSTAIRHLVSVSMSFLLTYCSRIPLVSCVDSKRYFAFSANEAPRLLSRPANEDIFITDRDFVLAQWDKWAKSKRQKPISLGAWYTAALAPCLAMELFDRQNKKGPATYFECLIGHIFARVLGVEPRKKASLLVGKKQVRLTMDFLFDRPHAKSVHLPVKMSTRERVVQAWAHQRMLDEAFGSGAYVGIMVLFCETKLDSRNREVVEICVPDQWLAYQALLAKIKRIYYFDVPCRYQTLTDDYPDLIEIRSFDQFFKEITSALG